MNSPTSRLKRKRCYHSARCRRLIAQMEKDAPSVGVVNVELRCLVEDEILRRANGVRLELPVSLGRKGLCQVIAKLTQGSRLDMAKAPELDFLVQNKLLRTTLARFMERNHVSTEAILPIEYIIPAPGPSPRNGSLQIPDLPWIAAMDRLKRTHDGEACDIAVGSSDGNVAILSQKADAVLESSALGKNDSPVTAISSAASSHKYLAVARANGIVEVWRLDGASQLLGTCSTPNRIESGAPRAVTWIGNESKTLAVGYWNGTVALYPLPSDARAPATNGNSANQSSKSTPRKRKAAEDPFHIDNPLTLTGHSDTVSQLHFHTSSDDVISSSWDSSLRLWSTETGAMLRAYPSRTACTDFTLQWCAGQDRENTTNSAVSLIDGSVQLVDLRAGSKIGAAGSITNAHKGWVGSVAWRDRIVGSGGADDGTVKAWDVRSLRAPLMNVPEAHGEHGKVMSVMWTEGEHDMATLVTGGSDGHVRAYDTDLSGASTKKS